MGQEDKDASGKVVFLSYMIQRLLLAEREPAAQAIDPVTSLKNRHVAVAGDLMTFLWYEKFHRFWKVATKVLTDAAKSKSIPRLELAFPAL